METTTKAVRIGAVHRRNRCIASGTQKGTSLTFERRAEKKLVRSWTTGLTSETQTMKLKVGAEKLWQNYVDKNTDPYGGRCVSYAREWAELMEKDPTLATMKDGAFSDLAEETSKTADTDGITGFMYGAAVSMLFHCWQFGERLNDWHNGKYGKEKGAKGTVNPAILNIGPSGS